MSIGWSAEAPRNAAVAPTSAVVSAASSSRCSTSARWNAGAGTAAQFGVGRDQSVVSARRAAATAASASATVASGAYPRTSPVAGLTEETSAGFQPQFSADQQPPVNLPFLRDGRRFTIILLSDFHSVMKLHSHHPANQPFATETQRES